MRQSAIACAVCVLIWMAACVGAESTKPLSDEELTFQKLENITKARDLYALGDSEYKKGNLDGAVRAWAQVLELKPDSAPTKQCLTKARNELYKRYTEFAAKNPDELTHLTKLDYLIPLLPDRSDLPARKAELLGKLDPNQRKTYDFYNEALARLAKNDYKGAKESISSAEIYAGGAVCIADAVRVIDGLLNRQGAETTSAAATFLTAPADATATPRPFLIYDFYATWCGPCNRMRPVLDAIEQEYAGKIEVKRFDVDKDIEMKRKYNITSMPTLIFFNPSGQQVHRVSGGLLRAHFLKIFREIGIK